MPSYAEINVDAWMRLLQQVQTSAGGCYGTLAAAAMVRALVQNTRATIDGLPQIPSVQSAVRPVRDELALLEARSESYVTGLQAMTDPTSADSRIDCERVYAWLTTGVTPDEPPLAPVLRMGDGRLAATLWNQVAAVAAAEQENLRDHPFPDAWTTMRELLGNAERQLLDTAAPGETPTARDAAVGTVREAAADVAKFVKDRADDVARLATWLGVAAAVVLALFLWMRFRKSPDRA